MGSGNGSKMSNNIDSFPILGYAEILAVKYVPLYSIPQFCNRLDNSFERVPLVVIEEPFDVFQEKIWRLCLFNNPNDFKKEISSLVSESLSLSCNGECLARKSSNQEINVWEFLWVDGGNVAIVCVMGKMGLINRYGVGIYF